MYTHVVSNEDGNSWICGACLDLVLLQGYLTHKKTPTTLGPP